MTEEIYTIAAAIAMPSEGETDLLDRASLHFTLALYDMDTDTPYFCEMDT